MSRVLQLGKCLFISFLPALSGVFVKPGAWYSSLNRPFLNPPNWVFGPVWTFLYLLMGLSLDKVYSEPQTEARKRGLRAFFTQLVLNACWTPVFFGAKMPGVALIVLAALIFTVILTIRNFLKINRIAGLILLPYLAWLCFAFYLNAAYKILNP